MHFLKNESKIQSTIMKPPKFVNIPGLSVNLVPILFSEVDEV